VDLAALHFSKSRWNISAQLDDLKISATREKLSAASRTGCSNAGSRGKTLERVGLCNRVYDENIARIVALEARDDVQIVGPLGWQVSQCVHAAIDFPLPESDLELPREEPNFSHGMSEVFALLVSGRLDDDDLTPLASRYEQGFHKTGPSERELGRPGPDAYQLFDLIRFQRQ